MAAMGTFDGRRELGPRPPGTAFATRAFHMRKP